jgi:hypothetical protein
LGGEALENVLIAALLGGRKRRFLLVMFFVLPHCCHKLDAKIGVLFVRMQ